MMKPWLAFAPILILILILSGALTLEGAEPADEQQLIGVLESDASLQQKDAACADLKRIGTEQSIPALAALLADEDLSHSARLALESMPMPEAGAALLDALDDTTGLIRAGIIQSLGQRREVKSVAPLVKLLADADPIAAAAASSSLGRIGGPEALAALQDALPRTRQADVRAAILDALLRIADGIIQDSAQSPEATEAFELFEQIHENANEESVRMAAYLGMIRSAGKRALALVTAGIQGSDGPARMAAMQMAGELPDPEVTKACVALLADLDPALQIAMIAALRQRGDMAATPAILNLAGGTDPLVRVAAVRALADLGDDSAVASLMEVACSGDETARKAARQSLLDLRRGNVSDALLLGLNSGVPEIREEAVRALTGRGQSEAVPRLLALAHQGGREATRTAACQALAQLAGAPEVGPLAGLVMAAETEEVRTPAANALSTLCRRLQARGEVINADPIVNGLNGGSPEARVAMFKAASYLADERVRIALREACGSPEPALRDAAMRTMAESSDTELMPDLLAMIRQPLEPALRVMAIRGYLRLHAAPENAAHSPAERVDALRQILTLTQSPSEQWLVLSALANIHAPEALEPALDLIGNPETRAEAAQAVVRIAGAIIATHEDAARAALQQVVAATPEGAQRQAAQAELKRMDEMAGFITAWQVAGPYHKDGLQCSALFDTVFPPETPEATDVVWENLPAGQNPAQPFVMDMLKTLGGNQRAGYARTRIYSDEARPASLEMGSDDGVKAWLNGQLVFTRNYIGPLVVNQNKVDVQLEKGWNTLMLKVTQNIMGWEFCVRLANPDGSAIKEIRVDPVYAAGESAAPLHAEPTTMAIDQDSPVQFRRMRLDPLFRSEGVAVADFNNDGQMDVATGNMLYPGSGVARPMQAEPKQYAPEGYSNEFYCFAEDLNHDGWMDLIVVGFPGAQTRWMENPGKAGGPWAERLAIEMTGNESPDWLDVDGDGRKEMVFLAEQGVAMARPGEDPTQPWPITVIAGPDDPRLGHGLGVGDINSDGRNDILCPEGWWEAPASPEQTPWTFHAAKLGYEAPAQMCVYDVDGDGDADVISSAAHRYGIWWYEQTPEGWKPHQIDHGISQMHALHLADINGDDVMDVVSGKRFWAHREGDDGIDDPAVLCWYELRRGDSKPAWIRHIIDTDSGVGLHVAIADANGDGQLDIVTSSKKGVYIFTQERSE